MSKPTLGVIVGNRGFFPSHLCDTGRQIVLKGVGHGNMQVGCVPNLIRQVLEDAAVDQLDTTCIQRSAPLRVS